MSVKRGGGGGVIRHLHTIFGSYLSVQAHWIILPLHPSLFAIVLNALGRRRDLFSASLMHHVNGAVILFSAPEGLLRLVMCAGVVCSLPISRQISYLQSASEMRFACKKDELTPDIVCFVCSGCSSIIRFVASMMTNMKKRENKILMEL